jgi:hypothetical protein
MDEFFVQGVVGGVLNRHKNKTLDKDRIQTLMVEIASNIDRATQFTNVKELNIDEQNRNYNFIMDEMSQDEREHLFNWQQEDNKYIYESPDGKYVFRRLAGKEYTPEQKEEIDLKTGEPTGRTFADYPFGKAEDNPLSIEMWKGYVPPTGYGFKTKKEEEEYLKYWTCDICNRHTHEVDYDYLGNGTNHLSCELKQEELQKKSDKIMKKIDKEMKDFDLSKSESNENSKVDMGDK